MRGRKEGNEEEEKGRGDERDINCKRRMKGKESRVWITVLQGVLEGRRFWRLFIALQLRADSLPPSRLSSARREMWCFPLCEEEESDPSSFVVTAEFGKSQ